MNGSGAAPKNAWYADPHTILELLSTAGDEVTKIGSLKAGGLGEGIAFSPDGKYLYVGNFNDEDLQIFKVEGSKVVDTGKTLKLPGLPRFDAIKRAVSLRGTRKPCVLAVSFGLFCG